MNDHPYPRLTRRALFVLLRQLAALQSRARLRLGRHVLPAVEQHFLAAWSDYCRERAGVPAGPATDG